MQDLATTLVPSTTALLLWRFKKKKKKGSYLDIHVCKGVRRKMPYIISILHY